MKKINREIILKLFKHDFQIIELGTSYIDLGIKGVEDRQIVLYINYPGSIDTSIFLYKIESFAKIYQFEGKELNFDFIIKKFYEFS